jgi:DNA-binding transcriptional ArsR family regulator
MLDTILLGKTRAAILRELLLNVDRRVSFNELVRRVRSGAGAVSRELKVLGEAGLVTEEREGNQRFLAADQDSPLYGDIKSLISKCSGAGLVLREALKDIEDAVAVAFIFGSVAKGDEREHSDLDLFVVSSAGYSVVTERTRSVEDRLGRRVQVLYFDLNSGEDRSSLRKPAMRPIVRGPKIFVIGDESVLKTSVR